MDDKRSIYWFVGTLAVSACLNIWYKVKAQQYLIDRIRENPSKEEHKDERYLGYENTAFRWAVVFGYALLTVVVLTF